MQEPIDGEDENADDEHVLIYPHELIGGLQLLTGSHGLLQFDLIRMQYTPPFRRKISLS